MMHRIDPDSRVFVLDTGRLPQATHDVIDRVRERYDKRIEVLVPESAAVASMVSEHGMNLFYDSVEKRTALLRRAQGPAAQAATSPSSTRG
jgi:phosphoadenosine phosphosulfate reductase